MENSKKFRVREVDSELGRIPCSVYGILASGLKPKERLISFNLEDMLFILTCNGSYGYSANVLNRLMHRNNTNSIAIKTLADHVIGQGEAISAKIQDMTSDILSNNDFDADSLLPIRDISELKNVSEPVLDCLAVNDCGEIIDSYNNGKDKQYQIKDASLIEKTERSPDDCVYISIDDVGVKHQKDSRNENIKTMKTVENTVIHVQFHDSQYIITAVGMKKAFAYLNRKKPYICCYALRAELNYRNSRNPAEKANDIVVATRQKHNGMSWSFTGSGALASVTAMMKNGESHS